MEHVIKENSAILFLTEVSVQRGQQLITTMTTL
jgi:hypothetical protein